MAAAPLLGPLQNPDIFWHLSAGRWMVRHGALLRQEIFSFTFPGAPWANFEALTQLVYYGLFALAGLSGLWALKVALLAACGWVTLRTVRLYEPGWAWESAALVAWSAGAITLADARPDLFSMLGLAALLWMLERRRLLDARWGAADFAKIFVLFALWANFHAGFAFGLMLLGFYWAGSLAGRLSGTSGDGGRSVELAAAAGVAVLASVCNPYGIGPYEVMAECWLQRADLTRFIQEWQPISLRNGFHWPVWPVMALCFALLFKERGNKKLPLGLSAATLFFAYNGASHARLAANFNITVIPLVVCLAKEARWLDALKPRRLALAGLIYAGYVAWIISLSSWGGVFVGKHVPVGAAGFLAREKEAFSGLRVYNPWEWGGYLGFTLDPWHRVFADGRYTFHSLLPEMLDASSEAGKCQAFFARYGVTGALLRNTGVAFPTSRVYPDGKTKAFLRPWYLFYMPRQQWALVYFDAQALVFVDRRKVSKKWLSAHEYRYLRPGDEEAFADALERKEIPLAMVRKEENRHRVEALLY